MVVVGGGGGSRFIALVAFTCLCDSEQTERKQSEMTTIRRAPAIFNYLPVSGGGVDDVITDRPCDTERGRSRYTYSG